MGKGDLYALFRSGKLASVVIGCPLFRIAGSDFRIDRQVHDHTESDRGPNSIAEMGAEPAASSIASGSPPPPILTGLAIQNASFLLEDVTDRVRQLNRPLLTAGGLANIRRAIRVGLL